MNSRLLNKMKTLRERFFVKGEVAAGKKFRLDLQQMKREHERQMIQLQSAHKRELKLMEKEYNIKASQLDRRIQRLEMLIAEWENKVGQAKNIYSQSQELLASIKQAMYQDKKKFANLLDDEKSMESLNSTLNVLRQKSASSLQDLRII